MNKKDLVVSLADKAKISQVKASEIINLIFGIENGIVANELANGGNIAIPGFGTFEKKHRKSRQGVNPSTGDKITIAAKDYPTFKAGKTLKDRVA